MFAFLPFVGVTGKDKKEEPSTKQTPKEKGKLDKIVWNRKIFLTCSENLEFESLGKFSIHLEMSAWTNLI